jgi:hypothetical protein
MRMYLLADGGDEVLRLEGVVGLVLEVERDYPFAFPVDEVPPVVEDGLVGLAHHAYEF